jgi:hypothetical protein
LFKFPEGDPPSAITLLDHPAGKSHQQQ